MTVILVSGTELECANTNSLVNKSYKMPVLIFLISTETGNVTVLVLVARKVRLTASQ